MQDLFQIGSLAYNTQVVLLGTALLGMCAGLIGAFSVLRRRALLGDAVAHTALPGVCMAYFVVGDRSLPAFLLGALIFGIIGVSCVMFLRAYTRVREDAAIGIVLGTFFGLGIVLSRIIQNQPGGNRAGLDSFLLGRAASMVQDDVTLIFWVTLVTLIIVLLCYKEFRLLCFDREFAATQGWPVGFLDLLLMALVSLVTVVALPAVGVVLIAALLIIPAVAARFWTDRLVPMLILSALIGMSSGVTGTLLSAEIAGPTTALSRGLPTGPLVAIVAAITLAFSVVLSPSRGLIARFIRNREVKRSSDNWVP